MFKGNSEAWSSSKEQEMGCNPSTQQIEAGGLLHVEGQSELHSKQTKDFKSVFELLVRVSSGSIVNSCVIL